jgi:hypothetical protein
VRGAAGDGRPYRHREYGFTVTEHDPDRPWVVLGSEHHTVTLDDGLEFFKWSSQSWPRSRWTVELDPWQLSPRRPQ